MNDDEYLFHVHDWVEIPAGTGSDDYYKCLNCGKEIKIEKFEMTR